MMTAMYGWLMGRTQLAPIDNPVHADSRKAAQKTKHYVDGDGKLWY